jgi:prepilin-type N-terminal cleavage/methylation domain-containing protein
MKHTLASASRNASRRSMVFTPRGTVLRPGAGFTLIELLVVIAIIAILAAIIFPVFGTVRENTRRTACISNMQKLSQAVKLFELDNRRYPDYLFGPALNADGTVMITGTAAGLNMEQVAGFNKAILTGSTPAAERAVIRNVQSAYKNSLFPEYVNDLTTYRCPNNLDADRPGSTAAALAARFEQTPPGSFTQGFYKYDSYDANPAITGPTTINNAQYQVRYARVWSGVPLLDRAQIDSLTTDQRAIYQNQLVFRNPSNDTYLTMCTHHVPKGKIIVLWLNGQARVLDTQKLSNNARFAPSAGRDFDAYKMTPSNY